MEVTRVFHPIGQGAFYTESFDGNHMVVYDCGGKSRKFMAEYIDSFLPEKSKQQIDAVFISHLHNDHINGLEYLLSCANVKKIFLPLFTPNEIVEAVLFNAAYFSRRESSLTNHTIQLLLDSSTGDTQIVEVGEYKEGSVIQKKTQFISKKITTRGIGSGTQLIFIANTNSDTLPPKPQWVYIPYNTTFPSPSLNRKSIKDESVYKLAQKILEIYDRYESFDNRQWYKRCTENLIKLLELENINKLKEVYIALFGGIHNSQSMTVFSGLLKSDSEYLDVRIRSNILDGLCCNCKRRCTRLELGLCNFLYMGDFEAKIPSNLMNLKSFYEKFAVWDTLFGVQIPHHGSRDNYHKGLYEDRCFSVASVGIKNKYNHPHIDTLINIANQGCCPNVVTEDINTLKYQQFKIL